MVELSTRAAVRAALLPAAGSQKQSVIQVSRVNAASEHLVWKPTRPSQASACLGKRVIVLLLGLVCVCFHATVRHSIISLPLSECYVTIRAWGLIHFFDNKASLLKYNFLKLAITKTNYSIAKISIQIKHISNKMQKIMDFNLLKHC